MQTNCVYISDIRHISDLYGPISYAYILYRIHIRLYISDHIGYISDTYGLILYAYILYRIYMVPYRMHIYYIGYISDIYRIYMVPYRMHI